jgi:hypothetical protein
MDAFFLYLPACRGGGPHEAVFGVSSGDGGGDGEMWWWGCSRPSEHDLFLKHFYRPAPLCCGCEILWKNSRLNP